jgi:hypothetical protein
MKRAIVACMAAVALCAACEIFEDVEFIEGEPDASFASPAPAPSTNR